MTIQKHIRKILAIALWTILGAGLLVLLLAAVRTKKEMICSGYNIEINGSASGIWFIDKADIVKMLNEQNSIPVKGQKIESIDLEKMEARIESDIWILDAELFFDNNNILQVEITEREPIARLFTTQGLSFYIDSALVKLPLSDKMSARLPVFTDFPSSLVRRSKADSALLGEIRTLSNFILRDPFWMSQIVQISINQRREFEMIPLVGKHVIEFGTAADHEEKFRRLMIFYKQVFAKAGMERYSRIKLQYENQVVAEKNPLYLNRADSLLSVKQTERLIASTYDELPPIEGDTVVHNPASSKLPVQPKAANSVPLKTTTREKPVAKKETLRIQSPVKKTNPDQHRVPKAVMPAKD